MYVCMYYLICIFFLRMPELSYRASLAKTQALAFPYLVANSYFLLRINVLYLMYCKKTYLLNCQNIPVYLKKTYYRIYCYGVNLSKYR